MPDGIEFELRPLGGGHRLNHRFFRADGDRVVITHPELRRFVTVFPVAPDIEKYGLSAPLHTLRLTRRMDWKAFAPAGLRDGERAPVSLAMLNALILEDQRHVLKFLEALQKIGLDVFVIEPPGLFRHHRVFGEGVPREVAMFVDREYRRVIRQELSKMGVPVVSVPAKVLDADGFTNVEYMRHEQDNHHGNTDFGEVMLQQICEHLAPQRAERIAATS
jgi:hypothetical protein